MNYSKKDILLSISLMITIISFAIIFVVFCKPFYYYCINALNIDGLTGISKEIIKENYSILIDYQSIFYSGPLTLPNFAMSQTGRIHFEEVKTVFHVIQIVFGISLITSGSLLYNLLKKKEYLFIKLTSIITILVPLIIGFIAMIDFDKTFVLFHKIVFNNEYWIFDAYTDPVIKILPQDYFMYCFVLIVVIVVTICIILKRIYRRKEKEILNEII